ncbi:MAG: AI-2E family transporter [Caldilineaceae bacterium]
MNSPRWNNFTKIAVVSTLIVITIALFVTFRAMIAPTIVAFLLTFILSYPVNWVQQRTGWPRGITVLVVYAAVLLLLALMPALFVPRFLALSSSLDDTLTELLNQLRSAGGPLLTVGPFRLSLTNLLDESGNILRSLFAAVSPAPIVRGVTTGVLSIVYTLVLSYWLLKDLNRFQRFVIDLVPLDYQEEFRRLVGELGAIWQAFLRGQFILGIVTAVVTWIPLVIVGMPNAGGLALLAGLMELLPSIGPAISGTIGTMSALFSGSNWLPLGHLPFAIVVGLIYGIIGQIESVYFIPRFVGGRVKLHPAVTFAGIINGALAFGVLGVLLAAPTIASARILINYLYRKLTDQQPFEPLRHAQTAIRIPGLIAGRKIEVIVFDLEGVVSELDLQALEWADTKIRWLDPIVRTEYRKAAMRRLLIMLEGLTNFVASQLWRLKLQRDLERMQPILDWLRGFPLPGQYQLQPEIQAVLIDLRMKYRLALVTVRTRAEIAQFLDENGLDEGLFAAIVTRDEVRNSLPQSDTLALALQKLDALPEQVLMVSDTDVNLRAARAMEMATAGVLTGLGTANSLSDADIVVARADSLLEWL